MNLISGGAAVAANPPSNIRKSPILRSTSSLRRANSKNGNGSNAANDMNDRLHPNLQALVALHLTYPGFERDKREAEAIHFGTSDLSLSFDAALRRLKVKQRAHEEQRSIRSIHRSHPNLVTLDSLNLTYPGWKQDFTKAEKKHNDDPTSDIMDLIRKMQVKQFRHENDRTHSRLVEIENLKLSYPGWKADVRGLEKFHFEEAFFLPGDSLFRSKIDGLKRRQQIYLRSQKIRGTRVFLDDEEEIEVAPEITTKGSYAVLLGSDSKGSNGKGGDTDKGTPTSPENEPASDEERTDKQPARKTPYAVIADAPAITRSSSSRRDPEEEKPALSSLYIRSHSLDPSFLNNNNHRPDPPEMEPAKSVARGAVDCDAPVGGGSRKGSNGSVSKVQKKSDPQGNSNPVGSNASILPSQQRGNASISPHTPQSLQKLSSYIDVDTPKSNDDFVKDKEMGDDVFDLPPSGRRFSTTTYKVRRKAPRGNYSAPLFPSDDEISMASRALSELTSCTARAVAHDERSSAGVSHSSSWAVGSKAVGWVEQPSVASTSSCRALWAESPRSSYNVPQTPSSTHMQVESPRSTYNILPQTPSSLQVVYSMQDTPGRETNTQRAVIQQKPIDIMRYSAVAEESPRLEVLEKQTKLRSKKEKSRRKHRSSCSGSNVSSSRESHSASSRASMKSKKLGRCTICGDADKNHVFVPCGHLCACKDCAGQVITRKMACPVCRSLVTEAIQVFL